MDQPRQRIALIELVERDGHPARMVDVYAWPLTLGRALDNDVVIDDPHVAAHHVRIERDVAGALRLTVLDSVNGVIQGRRLVTAGEPLTLDAAGASLQLGATRLRLRLPGEALAPEKPLAGLARAGRAATLAAGAALLALALAEYALTLDPGADYSAWLPLLAGVPLALAAWCAIWALMSKLFQHRFDFAGHLRIALPWMLGIGGVDAGLPLVAAALDLPQLWQLTGLVQVVLLALWMRAHLWHVLPLHPRAVSVAVAVTALTGAALSVALTHRSTDSFSGAPYMSTLPLPALQLARANSTAALVQEMAPLAQQLSLRAKKARDDEDEGGADSAGE